MRSSGSKVPGILLGGDLSVLDGVSLVLGEEGHKCLITVHILFVYESLKPSLLDCYIFKQTFYVLFYRFPSRFQLIDLFLVLLRRAFS